MNIDAIFTSSQALVSTEKGSYPASLGYITYFISIGQIEKFSHYFPDEDFEKLKEYANVILEKCFSEKDNHKKIKAYFWCEEESKLRNEISMMHSQPAVGTDGFVEMVDSYKLTSLAAFMLLEAMYSIRYNIPIVKCPNCKQFFIGHHNGVLYCDRVYKNGKTCRQIGAKKQFADKVKANEILAKYEKIYQAAYYKKSKAADKKEQAALTEKLTLLKENRMKYRNGIINEADFIRFLDEFSSTLH